jgi:uncharacterized membrane protein YoaT (DUF817 family)
VDAAAGAAEAAKQNMQEAYQKAVKLSLNIKLQVLYFTLKKHRCNFQQFLMGFTFLFVTKNKHFPDFFRYKELLIIN